MFKVIVNQNLLKARDQKVLSLSVANYQRWTADNSKAPELMNKRVKENARVLRTMQKVPNVPPQDRRKKMRLTRGFCQPEDAQLKHEQYGVITLDGGFLQFKHLNTITQTVNRFLKNRDMGAEWRIRDPYHAITKHPIQAVMGGGKGKINYYVTPVKARQVLFEMYGNVEYEEVFPVLRAAARSLPMPARAVNKALLDELYAEERRIEEENENFFTFRELVTKNMQNCRSYITTYDLRQFGKLR